MKALVEQRFQISVGRIIRHSLVVLSLGVTVAGLNRRAAADDTPKVVEVRTFSELVAAIAPRRLVRLKPGSYLRDSDSESPNPHVLFREVHDGKELVIRDVEDLTLEGEGEVEILAAPRYAEVVSFSNVKRVSLRNLKLRHRDAGECAGGVLEFVDSSGINLTGLDLQGSGTVGLSTSGVTDLRLSNSSVSNCNSGIVHFANSKDIKIENTTLTQNRGSISIEGASEVRFRGVSVLDNESPYPLFDLSGDSSIRLDESRVERNRVTDLRGGEGKIEVNGGRVIDSGKLGTVATSSVAPELLQVGTFHGDEVSTRSGDSWFALSRSSKGFELVKVPVNIKAVPDPLGDDEKGEPTGKEVTTPPGTDPLILLRGVPSLRAGPVVTAFEGDPVHLYPGLRMSLQIAEQNYSLYAEGVARRSPAADGAAMEIREYAVGVDTMSEKRSISARLLSVETVSDDPGVPTLLWAGDLDRDDRLDVLLSTSDHYNLSEVTLYLSSVGDGTPLPIKAAVFRAVGC